MRRIGLVIAALALPTLALVPGGAPAGGVEPCTITGTAGDDVLKGTRRADVICGRGGDDVLVGRAGNDLLRGGAGRDRLDPGWGHNMLAGGGGRDTVRYDSLPSGRVDVDLGAGTVTGAVTDSLAAVEGVVGTDRDDRLAGSDGANRLYGGPGADEILPGRGDDLASGGNGPDTVSYADLEARRSDPGLVVDLRASKASGLSDADQVLGFVNVIGTPTSDLITGTDVRNLIHAGGGNDTIRPGMGNDHIDGGPGEVPEESGDILSYSDLTTVGVEVDLVLGTIHGPGDGTVTGIEYLTGSPQDDVLLGDDRINRIYGAAGDDLLEGRDDVDTLTGGDGDDRILPGPGGGRGDYIQAVQGDAGVDEVSFADIAGPLSVYQTFSWWRAIHLGDDTAVRSVEILYATPYDDDLQGGLGVTEVTVHGMGGTDEIDLADGFGGDVIRADPGSTCIGDPGDTISC